MADISDPNEPSAPPVTAVDPPGTEIPVADEVLTETSHESGASLNLIDPKLKARALKRIQGIVKGNGIKTEDVTLEDCQALVYPFEARTFVKLAPKYGIRIEPGMNKVAELAVNLEAFNKAIAGSVIESRTEPIKRQSIIDFLFQRPDKGFGIKDQKIAFHKLTRDFVMHEGCVTCSKNGKVRCQKCGADGMLTCNLCMGRRQIVCPQCRGTTKIAHGGTHRTCEKCRGDGKIACTRCVGRGQLKCPTCAATGTLQCEKCAGTGWLSHLAHVEMEAQLHFDFKRDLLPVEVSNMIDAFGSRLVEKGDVEVVLRPSAMTPEDIRRTEEPDDMIFIDYHAKAPFGPIQFRMRERVIPATLFGYHGKLIEAPSFLDDLTRKGQQVLAEAANGNGDVAEKIRRAAKYRMLCDVIIQAAGKARQRQALEILTARYPTGIGKDRLLALLLQADSALKSITRKPRILGLVAGMSVFAGAVTAYYLINGRAVLGLKGLSEPLLITMDALFVPLGMFMGTFTAQLLSMFAQKKAIAGLAPPEMMTRMIPKAGKTVWWALGAASIFLTGLLITLALLHPELAPPWLVKLFAKTDAPV